MIISVLFFSAFLGGISVFFVKRNNTRLLKLILAFSGAYLFSITVLHLIPDVYATHSHTIGLFVLGGFLFQLLLEQFSEGVEHGHMHHLPNAAKGIFPLGVMISLCLHALLEGMPLSGGHQNTLLFGIALHHIPAAFALASLLLNSALSKRKIVIMIIIFASMSPLGHLLSNMIKISSVGDISQYYDRMMAVVIGIFLHISTTILFESSTADHQYNRQKIMVVLLGVSVSLLNFLFH
jgi:zinc transporter ZupT